MNKFNGVVEVRLNLNGFAAENEMSMLDRLFNTKKGIDGYCLSDKYSHYEKVNGEFKGIVEVALRVSDIMVDKTQTLMQTLFPASASVNVMKCLSCNVTCVDAASGKEVDGLVE